MDGKRYERDFEILIDSTVIARQQLKPDRPDELYVVNYEIPLELTRGKDRVEVKFASFPGHRSGQCLRYTDH